MLTGVVYCCLLFDELVLQLFSVQGSLLLPFLMFVEKTVFFIFAVGDQSHFVLDQVFRLIPLVFLKGVAVLGKHFTIEGERLMAINNNLFHENRIRAGRHNTTKITIG